MERRESAPGFLRAVFFRNRSVRSEEYCSSRFQPQQVDRVGKPPPMNRQPASYVATLACSDCGRQPIKFSWRHPDRSRIDRATGEFPRVSALEYWTIAAARL